MNTSPLDGNAAAGDLADVFAFDVTIAVTDVRDLPPHPAVADAARLPAGPRHGAALRLVRCRPAPPRPLARRRGSTCAASRCSRSPRPTAAD